MNTALLHNTFDARIDARRAMTIPIALRQQVAEVTLALIAVPGENKKLWLYPEQYFRALTPEMDSSERIIAFHAGIAVATRLEFDKRGRVLLPEKLILYFGLRDEVTLVGAGDHFEVWNTVDVQTGLP